MEQPTLVFVLDPSMSLHVCVDISVSDRSTVSSTGLHGSKTTHILGSSNVKIRLRHDKIFAV